ncbi:unnamed protein product [Rodentolepis nana]|uniref:Uncharacterized protein n=1 Tax=Rodentolepis nana TaxID=102285 RepID=A0A0R3TP65_RODNA|nr:unnamed protein product [Rodentolepis nana]
MQLPLRIWRNIGRKTISARTSFTNGRNSSIQIIPVS